MNRALCLLALSALSSQAVAGKPIVKPNIVAVDTGNLAPLDYDAGQVKFIATSAETRGATAVMELTEAPGYKTGWHKHNAAEESFYVLEGVVTIQIENTIRQLPAGSYVLIPRGTPHAQGNFGKGPLRLLTTLTPGGFDAFFKDRVELAKTVKRADPQFKSRFDLLRAEHRSHVEVLGDWNPPQATAR